MKRDAFGIEHRPNCRAPEWTSARANTGSAVQRCRRCGVTWRPGDPSTTPQPTIRYPTQKGSKK